MTLLGTALRPAATRVMLLGSGELGKEVAIECQRLGVEVIAVDRYPDAPAMHVAHRSYVINMLDGEALRQLVEREKVQEATGAGTGGCHGGRCKSKILEIIEEN